MMRAIRCDHDGLKMAEVQSGHLILRGKHHGETHLMVVPLDELLRVQGHDGPGNSGLPRGHLDEVSHRVSGPDPE